MSEKVSKLQYWWPFPAIFARRSALVLEFRRLRMSCVGFRRTIHQHQRSFSRLFLHSIAAAVPCQPETLMLLFTGCKQCGLN